MLTGALIAGVIFGLYFTLVGLGLNLVFGVMRIVNLAHGDVLMLGGIAAWALFSAFGLHPVVTAFLVLAVFLLAGLPVYYAVVPRLLRSRDAEMLSLILFFGISQMIEAVTTIAIGATERSLPPRLMGVGPIILLGTRLPKAWFYSAAVSAVAVLAVYFYLYRTRLGTLTRAVMVSRDEALATGIDVNLVSAIAFGISLALAGIAGVFAPFIMGSITPNMGVALNITAFAVIVVGTLGNPVGTILGGIIYGVSVMLMQTYLSSWANLLPNLLLIAVLLVRPEGILGRKTRRA
ncbi:branched-chain amino acid ABC transporter permease [Rhodopila sp.]|jgi:branched-chain amino acid transport system permease protein|uniref:branched-chain amino acid ABC transporter permease n=1 Tax=Rhodopila sp. TaxID=2480087 RepID=UPI002BA54C4B|nr:branched-chain amino acid ABC transporter permease [Rhodopila sp.]HVZ10051.1 branched-chain amino acid ABC transporter permease [Rhodopila sp.]